MVLEIIVSLFQLDNFVQYLQPAVVNDQIFPNVAMGFGDTVPAMREHTIKVSFLLICERPISVRGGRRLQPSSPASVENLEFATHSRLRIMLGSFRFNYEYDYRRL